VAALLVVAAGSGLLLHPYAAETPFARNAYRGADIVSLVLVLPLLMLATRAARRGSGRGLLLWYGAMGYVAYQYGYTFAYRWSRLFPVYLALLSVSAFTLAAALIRLDPRRLSSTFDASTPARGVARFLWIVGGALGAMELAQIGAALVTGQAPQIVTETGHPTSPVYILDLGLVVPMLLLAGAWLRSGKPWGYVAAPIMLVKGAGVGFGLLAGNLVATVAGGRTDGPLNVLWAAIALGSSAACWWFLRHLAERWHGLGRARLNRHAGAALAHCAG